MSAVQVLRRHCVKSRNCSQRAIFPFSTVFSTLLVNFLPFTSNLKFVCNVFQFGSGLKFVVWERVKETRGCLQEGNMLTIGPFFHTGTLVSDLSLIPIYRQPLYQHCFVVYLRYHGIEFCHLSTIYFSLISEDCFVMTRFVVKRRYDSFACFWHHRHQVLPEFDPCCLKKVFNPFLHINLFNHIGEKKCRKTLWKKVKLLFLSNFTFFRNVFYALYILKSFNSHYSVVVCNFLELGTMSKWCIRNRVNASAIKKNR